MSIAHRQTERDLLANQVAFNALHTLRIHTHANCFIHQSSDRQRISHSSKDVNKTVIGKTNRDFRKLYQQRLTKLAQKVQREKLQACRSSDICPLQTPD